MRKTITIIVIIFEILLILFFKEINASEIPYAKVTVEVEDEKGRPVKDAEVMVAFSQPFVDDGEYGRMDYKTKTEMTDEKGTAVITGKSCKYIFCIVSKKGYYVSVVPNLYFKEIKNNKWQPWNKRIEVVLKRKIRPIPMYVKSESIYLPEFDKEIGYDLMAGDLVEPYGRGKISDLIFKGHFDYEKNGNYKFKLIITFSNKGDGIMEYNLKEKKWMSELYFPRYAPKEGYKGKLEKIFVSNHRLYKPDLRIKKCYFIRVRSEIKNGKLVKALYGKIPNGMYVGVTGEYLEDKKIFKKRVTIYFRYYLNPYGTRNMEFDTKENLFKEKGTNYNIIQP